MPVLEIQKVICDQCGKTAILESTESIKAYPWIAEVIQSTFQKRMYTHCGEFCLINATEKGVFAPKRIIETGVTEAAVKAAADQARQSQQATESLKQGKGVTIQGQ